MTNVIISGPTGDVGGHAALAASSYGTKVWPGMRTPSKANPLLAHLSADEEKKQSFERIHADLTDAASIRSRWHSTRPSSRRWRPTSSTARSRSIASRRTTLGAWRAPPADLLDDKDAAAASPAGEKKGTKVVYLCGPQLLSQDVAVNHLSKEAWIQRQVAVGMPPPVATYLAEAYAHGFTEEGYRRDMYEQAVANVKAITGRDPMPFEEYIRLHFDELVGKAAAGPGGTFSS